MIITLCGSARFEKHFKVWNQVLTLAGHEVFTISCYPSDKAGGYEAADKAILDAVHKRKIDASKAIAVLNVHAYIGESTMGEIEHAISTGKQIFPLESWGKGNGIGGMHTDEAQASKAAYGIPAGYGSPIATCRHPFEEQLSFSRLLGPAGARRSRLIEMVDAL